MRAMKIRMEPQDEYMHPLEGASNFNESMYFNVYDPSRARRRVPPPRQPRQRGLRRDDHVPLPARRAGRVHVRPARDLAQRRVRRRRHEVRGDHAVRGAADHLHRQGRASSTSRCRWRTRARRSPTTRTSTARSILDHRGIAPMYGGEPVNDDGSPLTEDLSGGFARGHYEQHIGGRGRDPRRRRGVGRRRLRPPRPLVGTALLAGAVVVPLAHHQLRRGRRASWSRSSRHATASSASAAWRCENGEYHHLDRATIETDWVGDDTYHQEMRVTAGVGRPRLRDHRQRAQPHPAAQPAHDARGRAARHAHLRGHDRVAWDGRTGYGLSEYLDQIIDGQPVGVAGSAVAGATGGAGVQVEEQNDGTRLTLRVVCPGLRPTRSRSSSTGTGAGAGRPHRGPRLRSVAASARRASLAHAASIPVGHRPRRHLGVADRRRPRGAGPARARLRADAVAIPVEAA